MNAKLPRLFKWFGSHDVPPWYKRLTVRDARLEQPLSKARYVVFDTELTGLDRAKDDIISIGAVRMQGTRIVLGETFYSLINPGRELAHDNVVVHRIRPSELENQPTIGAALHKFAEFVGDDVIVGHFVHLDLTFLNRDMQRLFKRTLRNPHIDTAVTSQWLDWEYGAYFGANAEYEQDPERNLFALARRYQVQVKDAHHALYDAFLTAHLWQRFLVKLPALGVRSVSDLLSIAKG